MARLATLAPMSEAPLLSCVELEPAGGPADAAVVWLHGLGADGHDFEPIVPELRLPAESRIRFIFPHAPNIPVTLNGGYVMPAWYDITGPALRRDQDEVGIRRSAERVTRLVDRERERGIPPHRIVLAGFSQGGALALHTALRYPERLAGVLVLSAYMLLEEALETERSPANAHAPILQCHGTLDPMVPEWRGAGARDVLLRLGHPLRYETYRIQHQVCLEEILLVGEWLTERLPPTPRAPAPPSP
jgi:phospholipase/carboxylesterase